MWAIINRYSRSDGKRSRSYCDCKCDACGSTESDVLVQNIKTKRCFKCNPKPIAKPKKIKPKVSKKEKAELSSNSPISHSQPPKLSRPYTTVESKMISLYKLNNPQSVVRYGIPKLAKMIAPEIAKDFKVGDTLVVERHKPYMSFPAIGKELGVSGERVRVIYNNAMKKLDGLINWDDIAVVDDNRDYLGGASKHYSSMVG